LLSRIYRASDRAPRGLYQKDVFELPPGYIDNHIKDRVGDTVMVIYAGIREYGVIDTIVYYWPELEEGVVCVVRSLGTKFKSAGYPPNVMILRKEKFYTGPFIPYIEYKFVDNSYLNMKDSLKTVMINSFVQEYSGNFNETGENPFYNIYVACFGKKSKSIPDTLYMVYACYASSESSWMTLLKIHKEGYQWIPETILKPHRGPTIAIDFNCAFDLDNDGVLEYYINNDIYHFTDDILTLIYEGPFIGDI
jgi:hypothetical protein